MPTRGHHNLSIIEAVETLSSIADLDFDREIGIAQQHEFVLQDEKIDYKTVHWLHQADASSTVHLVREIFRVILHYLRQFYRKEYGYVTDQKTIEGIKTIMVLVGEAAKKLDKYTHLFHQAHKKSVTEFKEYKQLQEFYLSKIARKIDEGVLGKWILGLSLGKWKKQKSIEAATSRAKTLAETKHVFVDLETVKKDTEYELFFIRKEDGSRFFSPRLLRNIKLVCDFGDYFGEKKGIDPLEGIAHWHDRILHNCARQLVKALGSRFQHFFHDIRKIKNQELVVILNKALMALLLSSHAQNLLRHNPTKSCSEYFEDFQTFLREALHNRTYQKWLVYPPKEHNHIAHDLLDFIHTICRHLYANLQGLEEMVPIIHKLVHESHQMVSREHVEAAKESKLISSRLGGDYTAMMKLMKRHPNGPLLKVLAILEENAFHVFDPLLQHNIPNQLFDLYMQDRRISHLRLAAPIYQEFINKAIVDEEFKGFLRGYSQPGLERKHLLINLQDRTSWREHARCAALEDLQHRPGMANALCVVTLATDTDFYHQLTPYHQVNHVHTFMEQFKEHLQSEYSGFYFPSSIPRQELLQFIDKAFEVIHRVFFSNKNVLLREHRLDFIEIFYLFLQLKVIDWVSPDSFSLTCKDGIDIGEAYSIELFTFLKLMSGQEWTEADWDHLNFMLYAPALLIRERVMLPERFNRMLSALRTIENAQAEFGLDHFKAIVQEGFFGVFKTSLLESILLLPR
ncbi:hypothetical protein [Candidatus Protochlamydia phocaeensis]|uniref:hypothetical protein n=1 Tax=Candidatus Protochlamydia phocaeensis TaxID=1414722 RepID=UPI0008384215|nr:hypothetical protein [Candidatus Protochlamydia phocaeensis]